MTELLELYDRIEAADCSRIEMSELETIVTEMRAAAEAVIATDHLPQEEYWVPKKRFDQVVNPESLLSVLDALERLQVDNASNLQRAIDHGYSRSHWEDSRSKLLELEEENVTELLEEDQDRRY